MLYTIFHSFVFTDYIDLELYLCMHTACSAVPPTMSMAVLLIYIPYRACDGYLSEPS